MLHILTHSFLYLLQCMYVCVLVNVCEYCHSDIPCLHYLVSVLVYAILRLFFNIKHHKAHLLECSTFQLILFVQFVTCVGMFVCVSISPLDVITRAPGVSCFVLMYATLRRSLHEAL
uniref:Uncharacterized protein n=1 Tax=Ixodes ricinus TaxID=34613 RepID=A0A147BMQ0_IXORI